MGRRSIPIQPIRDERNRAVTFVKRKAGLFKKAHELSVLCQVEIALVIVGSNGKIFEFSSSSIDQVMKRYKKTEVQEFKTTKDFTGQPQPTTYHARKSSQIDSEDEDEPIKEDQDYYYGSKRQGSVPKQAQIQQAQQEQAQQQVQQQAQQVRPPAPQVVAHPIQQQHAQPGGAHLPPQHMHQAPHHQMGLHRAAGQRMHASPSAGGRPKLTVQIPHAAAAQEQAKKQPTGWTPQRTMLPQWTGQEQGVSPTGNYYHPQMMELQRMQVQQGESTPVSTTLPSKYMSDVIQSPSNFFSSEWGVPWSANPNSGTARPGTNIQQAGAQQGGPSSSIQPQAQMPPGQDPRQIPHTAMYLQQNSGLYGGGMPSAGVGVQAMFQSSPVQFTPNDAKRKSEEHIHNEAKKQDF